MKVGKSQGTGPYHIQAEINMIPLIDVALVLLIIFMVISPILVKSQLKINLPKVTSASEEEQSALKIEVDKKGNFSFEGEVVPKQKLRSVLQAHLTTGHGASILIQADQDASFKDVVYVMDIAKQFKVQKMGVSVIPEIFSQ